MNHFGFSGAIVQTHSFADVSRKDFYSTVALCLKNAVDWDGRCGRRIRESECLPEQHLSGNTISESEPAVSGNSPGNIVFSTSGILSETMDVLLDE